MGKYDPLAEFLAAQKGKRALLTFTEIEEILGDSLPKSAYKYEAWWSGNSASWIFEGWRAVPNLRKQRIGFFADRVAKHQLERRLRPVEMKNRMQTRKRSRRATRSAKRTGVWGATAFGHVCRIEPRRDQGRLKFDRPHTRYDNTRHLPLNVWGEGPFCRFQIPRSHLAGGVYVVAVDGSAFYVGETENLATRFNNGYGSISPRNCFQGGQSTNCRINLFIGDAIGKGGKVELWFVESEERKSLEAHLIALLKPPWNRR